MNASYRKGIGQGEAFNLTPPTPSGLFGGGHLAGSTSPPGPLSHEGATLARTDPTPRPPTEVIGASSSLVPPHPPAPSGLFGGGHLAGSTSPPGPLSENRRGGDSGCSRYFGDENLERWRNVVPMPREARPSAKLLAAEFRREPTAPERAAWELLRNRRCLGLKFRRQEAVLSFILDFYCPSLLLGIEIDGRTHREDGAAERDAERDRLIQTQGIEIVRLPADQVSVPVLEAAIRPFLERRRWR